MPAGGLYNYDALAGAGSDTFGAIGSGWRAALLGTVAAGALWSMTPKPARALPPPPGPGCTYTTATTVTCTGDQSAGITSANFDTTVVDTLNVNTLTTNIAPPAGTDGIYFYRKDAGATITINSDTTPHSISVTGHADGIYASAPGDVTVNHTGDITSAGGIGIFLSSGDGKATVTSTGTISAFGDGISASGYGDVTVTHTGDITSQLGRGIHAYSTYGKVNVTITGAISAAGDGISASGYGDVTVTHTGDITSAGGIGIFLSSGYGKATVASTGTISGNLAGIIAKGDGDVTVTHTGDVTAQGIGIAAYSASGKASVTGTGNISARYGGIGAIAYGDVTVTHTGDITSAGGIGIGAYSAGGKATVTGTGTISALTDGISATAYGDVSVTHTGNITTQHGDGIYAYSHLGAVTIVSTGNIKVYGSCGCTADGIFARGYGAVSISHTGDITSANGFGIYASSFNRVSITSVGNITAYADGIHAESQFSDITINHTGDITSTTASAIYARERSNSDNIDVTVNGGRISGAYAGINLVGGVTNTVTVGATATVTGGTYAIVTGSQDDTVDNFGTVTGNVALGIGSNAFNNMAGGLFNSGATVDLDGGTLTNDGTLAPGGAGTVQTTTLSGNFVQNSGGKFAVDVNMAAGTADKLTVIAAGGATGTANLAGTVVPHVTSLAAPPQSFTILSAAGGTTDNGLTVQNSAAVKYQLAYPNANDVLLTVAGINFAPAGLTPNETAIGQHLQGAFGAGGGGLNTLLLYLANLDLATFASALDHLSPESYLAQTQAQLLASFGFTDTLFSCPLPANGQSLMGEGRCYWLQPSGHVGDHSAQTGYIGYDEKGAGITGGAQNELASNWYLDVGFGYERSHIDVDNALASAQGDVFHGGAALKYISGNWLVAGSVSGGIARYETSRYGIPTAGTATANADTDTLDLRLRFAYAFGTEAFYVKPLVDFDGIGLWRGAINESGAGALDLNVRSQNDWLASAAPALEFGTQWQHGTTVWRPYVRAGVRFLSEDSFSATASFEGSPAGVAPFTVTTPIDQTMAEVSAGVDVWQGGRFSLRVAYEGRFGAHSSENGGELKLRAQF